MNSIRTLSIACGLAAVATSMSCAPLSGPVTQREQTAAVGGLAGGAGGAIIGSMAGGAVAGGLFGIPIGAVAGWYIGDQMTREERIREARIEKNEDELERLRRENERLRRENEER
jgi:outer membrane lipoprotein SlyB